MDWQTLLCDDRIRSYKKQSSTDLRTEFEKDYHRIIGSASFRRLGQNISESIRTIIKDETFTPEHKAAVCDILQCAGLIHDIGNPPLATLARQPFRIGLRRI